MIRDIRIIQILPADNWYVLLDCRNDNGDMTDPRNLEYAEEPVVAFALCEYIQTYDVGDFDEEEDDTVVDAKIGKIAVVESYRFVRPVLQNFFYDGVGVQCEVHDSSRNEDEFGKIVEMYKGKGNHGYKTLAFNKKPTLEVIPDVAINIYEIENRDAYARILWYLFVNEDYKAVPNIYGFDVETEKMSMSLEPTTSTVEALNNLIKREIKDRTRYVLEANVGLNGKSPKSFSEIGKELGITSTGARGHRRKAINKLRKIIIRNDQLRKIFNIQHMVYIMTSCYWSTRVVGYDALYAYTMEDFEKKAKKRFDGVIPDRGTSKKEKVVEVYGMSIFPDGTEKNFITYLQY